MTADPCPHSWNTYELGPEMVREKQAQYVSVCGYCGEIVYGDSLTPEPAQRYS